jgi:hypothetical protein
LDSDFYDFSDGVKLCDHEKQTFIDDCFNSLVKNNEKFTFQGTGSFMVICMRCGDEIITIVTDNYKENTITI